VTTMLWLHAPHIAIPSKIRIVRSAHCNAMLARQLISLQFVDQGRKQARRSGLITTKKALQEYTVLTRVRCPPDSWSRFCCQLVRSALAASLTLRKRISTAPPPLPVLFPELFWSSISPASMRKQTNTQRK